MFFGLHLAMETASKSQRVLQFDEVASTILKMELLFRLSMVENSELYVFLALASSEPFRQALAEFSQEMRKYLSEEGQLTKDCPVPKKSQLETYVNAFSHITQTKGYSMSQYLDAENPSLGRFFESNIQKLDALNQAFNRYLKKSITLTGHPAGAPAMHL